MRRRTLLRLLATFARIGLFTFGGGLAMISMIDHVCVEEKGWLTHEELMNMTVVAESTPGPIAINCATFVGYQQAGLPGAACATLGVVFPSFLILFAISMFFDRFLEITVISNAFRGIRLAVGVLILDAAVRMIRQMKKSAFSVGVLLCAAAAALCVNAFSLPVSTVALLLIAAAVGLIRAAAGRGGKGGAS